MHLSSVFWFIVRGFKSRWTFVGIKCLESVRRNAVEICVRRATQSSRAVLPERIRDEGVQHGYFAGRSMASGGLVRSGVSTEQRPGECHPIGHACKSGLGKEAARSGGCFPT